MQQLTLLISIFVILNYFLLLNRDKKENLTNTKTPIESILILSINIIGLLTFIMPWVNLPLFGPINAIKLSERFEEIIPIMIILGIIYLTFIFGSIIQISNKIIKKSTATNIIEIVLPLLVSFFGYLGISEIQSRFEPKVDSAFENALSMSVSIGYGLYLIVILGVIQAIICGVMNEKTVLKSDAKPMSIETNFHELRKYKQLLDEGIISNEEFAKKKQELI